MSLLHCYVTIAECIGQASKPIMGTLQSTKYIGMAVKQIHTYKCYKVLGYMYRSSARAAQLMSLPHYYGSIKGCTDLAAHPIMHTSYYTKYIESWMNEIA